MYLSSSSATSILFVIDSLLIVLCQVCQREGKDTNVIWPARNESSDELFVSENYRCLDDYKHYVTRTCSQMDGWLPVLAEIHCKYFLNQNDIRTTCPPSYRALNGDLDEIKVCISVGPLNEKWENTCLQSGSPLTFDKIWGLDKFVEDIDYYSNLHGTFFWLPAKKLWYNTLVDIESYSGKIDYGYQWTVAGKFGQNVDVAPPDSDTNDCLYTDFTELQPLSRDCDYLLPDMCLYDLQQPTMLQLSCPDGFKTTRYADLQHICIKIHKFVDPIQSDELIDDNYVKEQIFCNDLFDITSGSRLHIFKELSRGEQLNFSDRCLFRPNSQNHKMIVTEKEWTETDMNDIKYINWSFNASISPNLDDPDTYKRKILVARSNGEWMWEDGLITCAICYIDNIDPTRYPPVIQLIMDADNNPLVSVLHEISLWKDNYSPSALSCFSYTFMSKNIRTVQLTPIESHSEAFNYYRLSTNGMGRYWCTGLKMQTFEVIESEFFDWNIPLKFAIFARQKSASSPGQPSDQFDTFLKAVLDLKHFRIIETSLQTSSLVHLFHVTIVAITDKFLSFEDNLIGLDERMLIAYYILDYLNEIRLILDSLQTNFLILSVNSTEFCLPSTISNLDDFNWPGVRIGQYAKSDKICLLKRNGLPATQRCIGDGLFGGVWMESNDKIECNNNVQSPATLPLHKLARLQISSLETATNVIDQLKRIVFASHYSVLIAADIFYICQIMARIQYSASTYSLQRDDVTNILSIYNRLLMVDKEVMRMTSSLNTTNVLLNAVDVIMSNFAVSNTSIYGSNNGILSFQFDEPMLSTFIFNPKLTNFTGIVATNRSSHLTVEFLNKFLQIEDIMENTPDLIVASYIPAPLLELLQNPFIIVSLFINDILFHSSNNPNVPFQANNTVKSGSSILSIVLPGIDSSLPGLYKLPIFIKPNEPNDDHIDGGNVCGFWSFSPAINGWATDGCLLNRQLLANADIVVLCECVHLTHFAYLFYGDTPIDLKHFHKLQTITFIACSLSLAGLFGIYVSAILFRSWRITVSTKYLLQLSSALTLELIMILFVNTEHHSLLWIATEKSPMCIAFGAVLHYSVLVTWMWMFVIGYMQYMRYVVVLRTHDSNNSFVASSLVGWVIPSIPVATVLFTDCQSYVPTTGDYNKICYPSGLSLYLALMTPISIITTANLIIFVLIVKSLMKSSALAEQNKTRAMMLSKLRLFVFLFFLLGLTWIFSFLATTNAGVAFTYLFCATATLQGFVLFFYFVILDPIVRGLWVALCWRRN